MVLVILLPTHKEIVEFANTLLRTENKPDWKFIPRNFDVGKPRERQRPDYYDLNLYLKNNGLKIQYVGNDFGSLENSSKEKNVIVMTYDSSKGLDFDNVFLLSITNAANNANNKLSTAVAIMICICLGLSGCTETLAFSTIINDGGLLSTIN